MEIITMWVTYFSFNQTWYLQIPSQQGFRYPFVGDTAADQFTNVKNFARIMKEEGLEGLEENLTTMVNTAGYEGTTEQFIENSLGVANRLVYGPEITTVFTMPENPENVELIEAVPDLGEAFVDFLAALA